MKWIGQHIWDFISRFRSDVYLEGISTSTETDMLVVDSVGKVTKRAIDAITVDVSDFMVDGADNRILTATGTDAILAETYATFVNTGNNSTLKLISNEDPNDYCSFYTTTGGETTILTTNNAGGLPAYDAHLNLSAIGLLTISGRGTKAYNTFGSDQPAFLIDNNMANQHSLDIDGQNTDSNSINIQGDTLNTGNAIFIDCDSLTTGSVFNADVDDALTTNATKSLIKIDYDKGGITATGQTSDTTGLDISMEDSVINVGTVNQTGINVNMDFDNAGGTLVQKGLVLGIGADDVGDAAAAVGIEMEVIDGGTDIICKSSADPNDHFSIATKEDGETTFTTFENGGGSTAHLNFNTDGDIKFNLLDSGDTKFKMYVTGATNEFASFEGEEGNFARFQMYEMGGDSTTDYFKIETHENGLTYLITVDDAGEDADLNLDIDGDITLDSHTGYHYIKDNGTTFAAFINDSATIFKLDSSISSCPEIQLQNTNTDEFGPGLIFVKTATGADDDILGRIQWHGDNESNVLHQYAHIEASIKDATPDQEAGVLELKVADHDNTITTGLKLDGDQDDGEVDVTIGAGAASMTTIAGDLDIDGDNVTAAGALTITPGGTFTVAGGSNEIDLTTTGTLDVNVNALDMDLTDTSSIVLTASEAAEDLTVKVSGAYDSSLILRSDGTGTDAVNIYSSAGSVDIDSADNITIDAGDLITLTTSDTGADGKISLVSGVAGANTAIHLDGNANASSEVQIDAGILDIDVTGAATIDAASLTITGPTEIPARKFALPSDGAGNVDGDVVYIGTNTGGTATVAGKIYYYASTGLWVLTNSDDPGTATGLLAVALGTDPDVDGMLLRGMVDLAGNIVGTEALGSIIYLDKATAGDATTAAPTSPGDIVRVIGYALTTGDANKIWFNPDNTWVEHV